MLVTEQGKVHVLPCMARARADGGPDAVPIVVQRYRVGERHAVPDGRSSLELARQARVNVRPV